MTPAAGWALLFGATLGVGLWALLGLVPRVSAPRLAERIAPHLTDVSAEARRVMARRSVEPLPLLGLLGAPLLEWARSMLDRVLGGRDTIRWRLRASGDARTVERYRSEQLVALGVGGALGAGAAILLRSTPLVQIGLPVAMAALALLGRDWVLARQARRRLERMREELPTVLEFLMLALAAGEGMPDAVRRIARIGSGEVATELAGVTADVRTGVPFAVALSRLSRDLRLPPLSRAIEHLVAASERGAPLVDVLRAQAEDARTEAKRELLESAGRREIVMMVPLVFLILPVTVIIAVFPGLLVLQTGF